MKLALFSLNFVFDLEFDLGLEIDTIFKCVIKPLKHTLQK